MLVTEGKASGKGRRLYLLTALVLLAAAAVASALLPRVAAVILWADLAMAVGLVVRLLGFSAVARFVRQGPLPAAARVPSFAFLIPCLNELPSLRRTVPAMQALRPEGMLSFCYVVESASTDGSLAFLQEAARSDERVVVIDKLTPPGGRGAAIGYGLERAPSSDVVGFIDADHVMGQEALDALVRLFGSDDPAPGVQGVCAALNADAGMLPRLLSLERHWLELTELEVTPRLGGVCHFGGGQGFFRRALMAEDLLAMDHSMILDDIDVSVRLALHGYRIIFRSDVSTRSFQPGTFRELIDQRSRWMRGWIQLGPARVGQVLRWPGVPFHVRADLLRLFAMPLAAAWMYVGFGAAAGALVARAGVPVWLAVACLAWPLPMALGPCLAGDPDLRLRDLPLVAVGIPLTFCLHCALAAASVADACILRRPIRYAKTAKPG